MEHDLDNTLHGQIPSFPILFYRWIPPNQTLQCQHWLPARETLWSLSKQCQKTQQWLLSPPGQEYAAVNPAKYKDPHCLADCVDWFIQVVKQSHKLYVLPVGAIVGPAHLLNRMLRSIESIVYGVNMIMQIMIPTGLYISYNCWIMLCRSKIVDRILQFDIDIMMITQGKYASRFDVSQKSLWNTANGANSSTICIF